MPKLPKIAWDGEQAAVVEITGNPRNQEPTHMRIRFPGGEVDVTRVTDGPDADYWVHVRVNHPKDDDVKLEGVEAARLTDGRIDVKGKHASECDAGDLENPDMYHLAVRITRIGK